MSGDPQKECVWNANYDPAPFMQEHHAKILRLIVTSVHPDGVVEDGHMVIPPYMQAVAGEMACVRNAQAEGYPVLISFEFPNTWLPSQVAAWFGQVLPDFPHLWGVGIGNEQDFQYSQVSRDASLVRDRLCWSRHHDVHGQEGGQLRDSHDHEADTGPAA